MPQHTKDMLAEELRKIGLNEIAEKVIAGWYDRLAIPDAQFNFDLLEASITGNKQANEQRTRYNNGEFNTSKEEREEWANSPEGKQAFDNLRKKFHK